MGPSGSCMLPPLADNRETIEHEAWTPTRRWLALVGIWLVPGLLQCVQEATYASARGAEDVPIARILLHFLPSWLPWAAFTPGVLALTRRLPLERSSWVRRLPIHALACLALGLSHTLLLGWFRTTFPPGPFAARAFGDWLSGTLWSLHSQVEVLAYAGVVIAGHASQALRAARERELGAVQLRAQLSEARLSALQGQLRPHFLFNTLNAIDVLIVDEPQRAGAILRKLSELLRRTLDESAAEHSLGEELDHLRCYLDIEAERFSDRLRVQYRVDHDTVGLAVPNLVLQPLVENALRHGLAPLARGGSLTIGARRADNLLELFVEDDGVGLGCAQADDELQEGIGLGNTRARLAVLYGDRQELLIEPAPTGGTRVRVRIPAREAERAHA